MAAVACCQKVSAAPARFSRRGRAIGEQQHRVAVQLPEAAQQHKRCLRQGYEAVLAGVLLRPAQPLAARGSNENINGLARQFLPKGMDLSAFTPQKLAYIEALLNDRPRKVLDFRTPREVYDKMVQNKFAERIKQTENIALQA